MIFVDNAFCICLSECEIYRNCYRIIRYLTEQTAEQLFDVEPRNKADDFYPLDMRGKE